MGSLKRTSLLSRPEREEIHLRGQDDIHSGKENHALNSGITAEHTHQHYRPEPGRNNLEHH